MIGRRVANLAGALDGSPTRRFRWGVRLALTGHLLLLAGLVELALETALRSGFSRWAEIPSGFWAFGVLWLALSTPYYLSLKALSRTGPKSPLPALATPTLVAYLALTSLLFVQRMGSNDLLSGCLLGLEVFWAAILFGPRKAVPLAALFLLGLTGIWRLESDGWLVAASGFIPLGTETSSPLMSYASKTIWLSILGAFYLWFHHLYFKHNRQRSAYLSSLTDRLKGMLEEKERTQSQLVRSESLASIGQLVAGVAHELNNPLASAHSLLQSSIETLDRDPTGGSYEDAYDEALDDLRFALKEQHRASEIVRSLLELSRQTFQDDESVNLRHMLQNALRVLHPTIKENDVEVRERYLEGLPDFRANFAQMGQVAMNLIQNAVHAMESRPNKTLEIGTYLSGSEVGFYIEDSGPGIPRSMREDIFKPFFTTKPVDRGTGLGLYICHEIVTKHGGRISCGAGSMGGARFSVSMSPQSIFLSVVEGSKPLPPEGPIQQPLFNAAERNSE